MKITAETVQNIANLANLELSAEEIGAMQQDLSAILDYVEQLNQLQIADLPAMEHVLGAAVAAAAGQQPGSNEAAISEVTTRPDEPHPWFSQKEALANAPLSGAGHFKVPRIIDKG